MTKSIKHSVHYSHKPKAVWEYLTKSELIAQWLMPNDFKPIIGCEFQFRHSALPNFNLDGIVYCKVLEMIPYKKLSYSWKAGPGEGKISLDSIVTITLIEKDSGTEMTLQHDGFTSVNDSLFAIMDQGWLSNIKKINKLN
jgi:uncharacterized protein YndB with AHSA1/START domain